MQAEPHLKMETKTVGELGPDKLEDLDPGQQAATSLVATGVSFDGYVIHMEVFDCGGRGHMPQTSGEGAEGSGGGSGPALAPDETYDGVIGGARLGPVLRRFRQRLHRRRGEHQLQRPHQRVGGGPPVQRGGVGPGIPARPVSGGADRRPSPIDAGSVRHVDGPRRGRQR